MNRIRLIISFSIISGFGFSGIFLSSCKKKSFEGSIVFTQVIEGDVNLASQVPARQKSQSGIAALSPDKSGSQPVLLTKEFYSARSPEISNDGTRILFSAQQKQDDPWQIWEMEPGNLKSRKVISLPENCSDPAYLPNGRVIFSKQSLKDNPDSGFDIVSCNSDGSDVRQVTFNPCSYSASTVLKDGRVLAISKQLNSGADAVFMVLRPDGTKNELFYNPSAGSHPAGRGWETENGKIVFVESDKSKADYGKLISVNYSHPLHSCANLSSSIEGDFISVFPHRDQYSQK